MSTSDTSERDNTSTAPPTWLGCSSLQRACLISILTAPAATLATSRIAGSNPVPTLLGTVLAMVISLALKDPVSEPDLDIASSDATEKKRARIALAILGLIALRTAMTPDRIPELPTEYSIPLATDFLSNAFKVHRLVPIGDTEAGTPASTSHSE